LQKTLEAHWIAINEKAITPLARDDGFLFSG
jgi:hypothetical protein